MSFATKLCHVVYADGSAHDVMKHPATDKGKISLPGEYAHLNAQQQSGEILTALTGVCVCQGASTRTLCVCLLASSHMLHAYSAWHTG